MENDIKAIIFAHHRAVLDGIQDQIEKLKIKFIRIDGSIDAEARQAHIDRFQNDEEVKVAILSITAAGTGFNLTAASLCVFAEMHWTPAIMLQAEDRIHRIG